MEHAPLRPVPSRPAGPIDPAVATREVSAALPELSAVEARALALVVLAERPRAEVAGTLGIEERELGSVLASARKKLRRTVSVLGGSGWCERAEGLISDRFDGALTPADAHRLDVHLRNCPRCVEHERRLVQATDWLVAGLAGPAPPPPAALPPGPPTPEPPAPIEEAPTETPPSEAPPSETPPAETPPGETPPEEPPPAEPPPDEAPPAAETAPTPADIAAAAEVLVAVRTRRQIAAAVTWNALIAIAILLALVTIGLTAAGIVGVEL